jgi:hypothetical protein
MANWSMLEAPSTLDCPLESGRGGPSRAIPCASRLLTIRSAALEAESTRCSRGSRPVPPRPSWMTSVHWASCTVTGVVWVCASKWTVSSSHVALQCAIEPPTWCPLNSVRHNSCRGGVRRSQYTIDSYATCTGASPSCKKEGHRHGALPSTLAVRGDPPRVQIFSPPGPAL